MGIPVNCLTLCRYGCIPYMAWCSATFLSSHKYRQWQRTIDNEPGLPIFQHLYPTRYFWSIRIRASCNPWLAAEEFSISVQALNIFNKLSSLCGIFPLIFYSMLNFNNHILMDASHRLKLTKEWPTNWMYHTRYVSHFSCIYLYLKPLSSKWIPL
jgi:hypothetical protein